MLIGIKCEELEKDVSLKECLECAKTRKNKCHFTYPIIKKMFGYIEPRNFLSVTSLSGCIRCSYLGRNYDYYSPIENLYWLFRGNLFHSAIEQMNVEDKDVISEKRFVKEYKGIKLSAKPDEIVIPTKEIIDYKSTAELPKYNKPYSNHTLQVNLYKWIVEQEIGFKIEKLTLHYLSMKGSKIIPAKIMSEEDIITYLDKKLVPLNEAYLTKIPPVKPPVDSPDRWQCKGYCLVNNICEDLYEKDIREQVKKELCDNCKLKKKIK